MKQLGCFFDVFLFIFTARVRTYDGRLCFHRCVSVQLWGGGGWYPISGLMVGRGLPHPRSDGGGYLSPGQMVGGVPHPRSNGGGGVPHPRSGWWRGSRGTPPGQVWMVGGYPGYPQPGLDDGGYLGYPHRQVWMVGVPGVPPRPGLDGGGYPGYPPP